MAEPPFDHNERLRHAQPNIFASQAAQAQATLQRVLAPSIEAGQAAMRNFLDSEAARTRARFEQMPRVEFSEPLRKAIEQMNRAMRDSWERGIPPNLLSLEDDLIFAAIDASAGIGPCMIWAPRGEIVAEQLGVKSYAKRAAILIDHRDEVMADLAELMKQASPTLADTQPELDRFASGAVAAAADSHDDAAQALTAAVVGVLVHDIFGHSRVWKARKKMEARNVDDALLGQVRYYTLDRLTARALAGTKRRLKGFNRHGILHGKVAYFGEGEMLAGLLLLVAWARELAWWAENEPEAFTNSA
jgi:hypothetical protein